jgi:hypothetical protein
LPIAYAPVHGCAASATPIVGNGMFGVIAAITGQLMYAVIFPSR